MTEDEARSMSRRIIETWPMGAKGYVWAETLKGLDYEPAMDAYRTLRGDAVRTPVIGELMALYRTARSRARAEVAPSRPEPTGRTMSLAEYLDVQGRKADGGNVEAADNLTAWQRAMRIMPTIIPMNRSTA